MIPYKLSNAAAHIITVTATATSLFDLIDTAAGAAQSLPSSLDKVVINNVDPTGNAVRYLNDGNTPTGTEGETISNGEKKTDTGVLSKIMLVRHDDAAVNVVIEVQVGWAKNN